MSSCGKCDSHQIDQSETQTDRCTAASTARVRGIYIRSGHLTKLTVASPSSVLFQLGLAVLPRCSRERCAPANAGSGLCCMRGRARARDDAQPHRLSTATIHPSSPMGVRCPSLRLRAFRIVMNQFRQPKTKPDHALSMRICTIDSPTPSYE